MDKKKRKTIIDNLNRRKRELIKKGASPDGLYSVFQQPFSKKFIDLTDNQLLKIYNNVKGKKLVVAENNNVYDEKYLKNTALWYGTPLYSDKGFQASLSSNLMGVDVKKKKELQDREVVKRYKEHFKDVLNLKRDTVNNEIEEIKKTNLTKTQKNKMIKELQTSLNKFEKFNNKLDTMSYRSLKNFISKTDELITVSDVVDSKPFTKDFRLEELANRFTIALRNFR